MNNSENNSLIKINEKSIFYRIKNFFRNLFGKNKANEYSNPTISPNVENIKQNQQTKSEFMNSIKNTENEETKLYKLQQRYENNELSESDLTDEQVDNLLDLYQDQIDDLEKANSFRKQQLLSYRKNMQSA